MITRNPIRHFLVLLIIACVCGLSMLVPATAQLSLKFAFNPANTPQGGKVEVMDIAVDASGNRYVTGYFIRSANVNTTSGGPNYIRSRGGRDIFIAKYASDGSYVWAHSFGDGTAGQEAGRAIAVDASGNIYVAGDYYGTVDFNPGSGTATLTSMQSGAFLAKYDADGNNVWARKIDTAGTHRIDDIAIDMNNDIVVTGVYQSNTDFDPSASYAYLTAGSTQQFFAKYTSSGSYVFAKQLSSSQAHAPEENMYSISTDVNGNILLAGVFINTTDFDPDAGVTSLTPIQYQDAYYAKYTSTGAFVFVKQIGGTSDQVIKGIDVHTDGSIFITGYFYSTVDFDPGAGTQNLTATTNESMFVARYDISGNYVWAFKVGTNMARGQSLILDASGNAVVTGYFTGTQNFNPSGTNSLSGTHEAFVAKYSSTGAYLWAFKLGNSVGTFSSETDEGTSLAIDGSSNIYVGGSFLNTIDFDPSTSVTNLYNPNFVADSARNGFHAKYTSAGALVNCASIGGITALPPNEFQSYHATDASGNIYYAGNFTIPVDVDPSNGVTNTTTNSYYIPEMFLAKYSSTGTLLWQKSIGGTGVDQVLALTLDGSGNPIMAGWFASTVDFDPSASTLQLTSSGNQDIFFAKYDSNGNVIWAKKVGGTSNEIVNDITLDLSGNIFLTGNFQGTADFNPNPSVTNNLTASAQDIYLAKYTSSGDYVWAFRLGGTASGDDGRSVKTDSSGNVYLCGHFSGSNVDFDPGSGTFLLSTPTSNNDAFFAKYNASGTLQWAKQITGNGDERMLSLVIDGNSDIITLGTYQSGADLDPNSGVIGGTTGSSSEASIVLAKYSNSGSFVWADIFNRGINGQGSSLAVDSDNFIYMATQFGQFANSTVDFNPGSGVHNLTTNGSADIVLGKYKADGTYVWATSIGGGGDDFVNKVSLDAYNNICLSGAFFSGTTYGDSIDFDPSNTRTRNLAAEQADIYLAKFGQYYVITPSPDPYVRAYGTYPGTLLVETESTVPYSVFTPTNNCVQDVLVNGSSVGSVTSYTFTNITSDQTI
ncbi:MAG: hypothetical protein JNJ85_06185, partial [Candidatus Kapabacteria bacterium]|nr:hypothetical protein [Candidatus Kapabacteria bacterium]